MPAQSLPPFLIISLGVAGIGFCQAGVNWLFKANKVLPLLPFFHVSIFYVLSIEIFN
ncbi:hypothetical protein GUITHDRAFT_150377 [Guillardia theta CCMP2712]|uniref:Uncharacterized protein n=1 Tax=Guillardia theta (strain CCMP2712) TaxID=905079 RepID=L1JY94_GUITC|nr:hypothetical protein GUITHDRAFT_150377 [Guillardia theta CCMP2712]EKX53317.1 hypothetical protein GUITHDRAFT_150377 [Guillardia theta CCMP2712]|eukprot:XP_005840297.1 hypothetical protein GUITHDRAFT_150377 [Guillardia theta CCMP2712]